MASQEEFWCTPLEDLVRHMIYESDMSASEISRSIGKSSGYIATMLSEGRTPRLGLLASIAEACGYSLQLRGHGEAFVLVDRQSMASRLLPTDILADYPDAKVFAIQEEDIDDLGKADAAPSPTIEGSPIGWPQTVVETLEELAQRDPEGHAEYLREINEIDRIYLAYQDRLDAALEGAAKSLREAFIRRSFGRPEPSSGSKQIQPATIPQNRKKRYNG